MRLLDMIRAMRNFKKTLKNEVNDISVKQEVYKNMTHDELVSLPDGELITAAFDRVNGKLDGADFEEGSSALTSLLSEPERVLYAVFLLEVEVNNGGLCQFFINSSRAAAPFVSDSLDLIGAHECRALYDGFIKKYGIDDSDLSSFDSPTTEAFSAQYDRYPFDEFDDEFYTLDSLDGRLAAYVREHIESF